MRKYLVFFKNISIALLCFTSFALMAEPFKVISLSPHTTELVYDAGLGENLIAVSSYSDYPEAAKKIEQVASYQGINIERILMLKPDLVVAWKGGNPQRSLEKLESLGIKIFYSNPKSLEDIANNIETLGQYAKNPEIAKTNANNLRHEINQLKEKYSNKEKVSYFYQLSQASLMTHSEKYWPQAIFTLCGGKNIFAKSAAAYPIASLEEILVKKPKTIFTSNNDKLYLNWQKWEKHLLAVKNNMIFSIDGNGLSRPTSRAIDAAKQVCEFLEKARNDENTD